MPDREVLGSATDDASPDLRPGRIAPAQLADRYLLLDRIGEGGSADVYTAYDRKLDRKIALKILRDPGFEARLLREAQALARLRHPNVVQVYDCGSLGDRVFLAMELVAGGTLRSWLDEAPRGWREALAVFVAAGRGLAAMHAAGLVHRDFKPDNVLVDTDGTVRVADLGLVRLSDALDAAPPESPLAVDLTMTGGVVGTPRYIAPEHHSGLPVTARGDQFSFCAALYLGLFRQPAFAGDSVAEIKANIEAGRPSPPPAGHRVPGWLVRAVTRGLATDPAQRWPSITALLAELTRDRGRRARLALYGSAVAAAALGLVVALTRAPAAPACAGAAARLVGVWDPARREAVHRAFAASHRGYAEQTFSRTAEILDGYTAAWTAMREDACQSTAVRHEQSAELLDLRMACLDRRLQRVGALIGVFAAGPDDAVVDRAVTAAAQLESLDGCADPEALRAAAPRPSDPALRARVAALSTLVDRSAALSNAGQFKQAEALVEPVVAEARLLPYTPLLADAISALLEARLALGRGRASGLLAREGLRAAVTARDARVESLAWIGLIKVVLAESKLPEAINHGVGAEAAILRAGNPPDLRARFLFHLARALYRQDRNEEARRAVEEAIALGEAAKLPAAVFGSFLDLHGMMILREDRVDEAVAVFERSAAAYATLGEGHPFRADPMMDLGNARTRVGDTVGARAVLVQALAIVEQALGPDHLEVAIALGDLAEVDNRELRWADAEARARRSLRIKEMVLGPEGYSVPTSLDTLAVAVDHLGRTDEADRLFDRALALRQKLQTGGADIAVTRVLLAAHHRHAGRLAEAGADADHALAVLDGVTIRDRMDRLITLAEVRLDQGRAADAAALLDRADKVARPGPDRLRLVFARARADWELGRDHAAALGSARAVLASATENGDDWLRAEVRAWLAHPRGSAGRRAAREAIRGL